MTRDNMLRLLDMIFGSIPEQIQLYRHIAPQRVCPVPYMAEHRLPAPALLPQVRRYLAAQVRVRQVQVEQVGMHVVHPLGNNLHPHSPGTLPYQQIHNIAMIHILHPRL